jgi:hypothetical protein
MPNELLYTLLAAWIAVGVIGSHWVILDYAMQSTLDDIAYSAKRSLAEDEERAKNRLNYLKYYRKEETCIS